jgi:hypothetical protein
MKKLLAVCFAGWLIVCSPACSPRVDRADEPVEGLEVEGVPPLDDDTEAGDTGGSAAGGAEDG